MARHARSPERRSRRALVGAGVALAALAASAGVAIVGVGSSTTPSSHHVVKEKGSDESARSNATPPTTATSSPSSSVPLPQPAGPGFVPGKVTAVGDSVMLDYEDPLKEAIPGIDVEAAVSRQWSDGEFLLQALKSQGQLGADVIVGLGTNGPVTDTDFDAMMSILAGASRVVFVNVHVDRPWQDPNNAVLSRGAARYDNVVVADWSTLAAQHPEWFGPDGTHLGIDGPGADALAALVSTTLANG